MKNRGWIAFLSWVVAYVVSRIIFALFDFSYNVFTEPFNIIKFVIDFGVWAAIYAISYFVLARVLGSKQT